MTDIPTVAAWDTPQETVDETEFTPRAEKGGWLAWNGQSPEVEVCLFVASLIMMMRPKLVIETGVGQGYMTRAIVPMLNDGEHLVAYESNHDWRTSMWSLPFWVDNRFVCHLAPDRTPTVEMLEAADLCILDSDFMYRFSEIKRWHEHAKPGAVALIHDTSSQPDTVHAAVRELIIELGMTGSFLNNPRGSFMAIQR